MGGAQEGMTVDGNDKYITNIVNNNKDDVSGLQET